MNKSFLIILEGMSTSGKTMVMNLLCDGLKARGIKVAGFEEQQTLSREVFTHIDPKRSLKEMHNFLEMECSEEDKVVICDRFHLSHMAITNGSIKDFKTIESEIARANSLLVFLEIPEDKINDRLINAKAHRSEQWEEELKSKGQTEKEAIKWFKGTQPKLHDLFEKSILPKIKFNTEETTFQQIASIIAEKIVAMFVVRPHQKPS